MTQLTFLQTRENILFFSIFPSFVLCSIFAYFNGFNLCEEKKIQITLTSTILFRNFYKTAIVKWNKDVSKKP